MVESGELPPASEPAAWSELRRRFPWPDRRPDVAAIDWSMDYGGRDLVLEAIRRRKFRVVVEIGVFLGGSVRQWLGASPDVVAIAIDPWHDLDHHRDRASFIARHPIGRRHADQLFAPGGHHASFLASNWDFRHRIVPIRGVGIHVLPVLHAHGLKPDLIYIDADKKGTEIPRCTQLFPSALIGGDDWVWNDGRGFPIRAAARAAARVQGRTLKSVDNTWLIDDRPWSSVERRLWWRSLPSRVVHELHARRRRLLGQDSSGVPTSR